VHVIIVFRGADYSFGISDEQITKQLVYDKPFTSVRVYMCTSGNAYLHKIKHRNNDHTSLKQYI